MAQKMGCQLGTGALLLRALPPRCQMSQLNADQLKQKAAEQAVDHVENGILLGLGSGSTMRYVLHELARRLANGTLHNIIGVPSSDETAALARELGIPLGDFAQHNALDLAIDGADEIRSSI
jgi:ribose 5-phosphate isomerase A